MTDGPEQDPRDAHRREQEVYQHHLQQSLERRAYDQNGSLNRLVRRGRRQTEVRDVLSFLFAHLAQSLILFCSQSYRQDLSRRQRGGTAG
jgi:hypothetical protein